jgi:hypothetical protein
MTSTEAEIARLLYKYRRLILEGKISLPPDEAAKLIGPDRAYQLYFSLSARRAKRKKSGRR